jgi:hypothetical protein
MRLVATSLMVECGVPFSLTDADETRQARKQSSRYEGESVSVADSRRRRTAVSCSPRQSIWSTTFLTVSLVTARDWCIARRSLEWRLYVVTSRIRSKEVSRTLICSFSKTVFATFQNSASHVSPAS